MAIALLIAAAARLNYPIDRTGNLAAAHNAVGNGDLVDIQRRAHVRQRTPHQADAVVHGFLRLQMPKPQRRSRGRVRRQLDIRGRWSDVRRRIIFLRQCRCAKAIVDGAAQGELGRKIITGGEFPDRGIAEIAVVLESSCTIDAQSVDRLSRQIDIGRIVGAIVRGGVQGREARIGLRASRCVGKRHSGPDLVGFAAIFTAECHRQWTRQSDVEVAREVERRRPLGRLEKAVVEIDGRRDPCGVVSARVVRLDGRYVDVIAAVSGRQIPVPGSDAAFDSEIELIVVLIAGLLRVEAVRERINCRAARRGVLHLGRHAVVLIGSGVLVAVGSE